MDEMNIFFTFNNSYAQHISVVITSIIKNNPLVCLDFNLICNDITDRNKNLFDSYSSSKVRISFYSVDSSLFEKCGISIPYISKETYFRYIIPNIRPDLDKAIYLDGDVVVNGNLTPLWQEDISDFYIAGVEDVYINNIGYKVEIGFEEKELYVNAGVLLINMKKIRDDNKIKELFIKTEQLKNEIKFQDQDILNIVFKGKVKKVSNIYNYTFTDLISNPISKCKDVKVFHFNGPNKPWDYFYKSGNPAERYYFKYLLLSRSRLAFFKILSNHLRKKFLI